VGRLQGRIEIIFSEILLVCYEEGLLAGSHFALDGLKLPTNASREWSGSFEQLRFKQQKLQRKIAEKLAEHRRQDRLERKRAKSSGGGSTSQKEKTKLTASLDKLRRQAERIGCFLEENESKQGARKKEVQSNVTDNDSAKMETGHGMIQGYNAQALVDEKKHIIVHGQVSGCGQDYRQVGPVVEGAKEMLELGGLREDVRLEKAKLSADSSYHSEENLKACEAHGLDAYIPDNHFRMRDPRFASQERYREKERAERPRKGGFQLEDFSYHKENDCFICPAGKQLTLEAATARTQRGHEYRRCYAQASDLLGMPLAQSLPFGSAGRYPPQPACAKGRHNFCKAAPDAKPEDESQDRSSQKPQDLQPAPLNRGAGVCQSAQQQRHGSVLLPWQSKGAGPVAALLPGA
jgi:hypothetical protein